MEPSSLARALIAAQSSNPQRQQQQQQQQVNVEEKTQQTTSKEGTTVPFDFSVPSPDEIVARARRRAEHGDKANVVSEPSEERKPLVLLSPSTATSKTIILKEEEGEERQPPLPTSSGTGAATTTTTLRKDEKKSKAALVQEELDDEVDAKRKPQVSLVVVGHVDAGKSTLVGHLLTNLGLVSQKELHKLERESREMGKASFKFAFVMDVHDDERRRGVTVDVGMKRFETMNRRVILLDAPGHRDFVPNMITGVAQADAALLVVPACLGEFESSFVPGAQTREHAVLVSRLGVSRLIVAVNKMDSVDWSEARFNEIKAQLVPFLEKDAGFAACDVLLVPVSGMTGGNLTKREESLSSWYEGPTLLEAIDTLPPTKRPIAKPLRLIVSESGKILGTIIVWGRIEAGIVRTGDKVALRGPSLQANEFAIVKTISSHGEVVKRARAGDNVELGLQNVSDAAAARLDPGCVICDPNSLVPVATKLHVKVLALPLSAPIGGANLASTTILNGSTMLLHTHAVDGVPCTVERILSVSPSKKKSNVLPRVVLINQTAELIITTSKAVCVEAFDDLRPMSRLILRSGDVSVAAGVVVRVMESR